MGRTVPWSEAWNRLYQDKCWRTIQVSGVTAGTAAVELVSAGSAPLAERVMIKVFNDEAAGGATVYVGTTGVTVDNGWPVPPQTSFDFYVGDGTDLFVIAAADSKDVRVMEVA